MEWARREHGIHWAGMHVIQYPLYIPYNHTVTQPTTSITLMSIVIMFIVINIIITYTTSSRLKWCAD